ncbi:hypothetical protein [Derxia lacustris]|uniref:hypothetical protein n=1 Tax=Derxia lacustris TaxID=764842 RepID=UPI000A177066|nr:hypothetical protein [Derxia lacustris]
MKALAWLCLALLLLAGGSSRAGDADAVVVIGYAGLPPIDGATVERLYTGRSIAVAGTPVTVVNAAAGSPLRRRFLAGWLRLDEEKYAAYWTVRRHIGKGAPPRELAGNAETIEFVRSTPGAVGYIDAAEVKPGMNVIARP